MMRIGFDGSNREEFRPEAFVTYPISVAVDSVSRFVPGYRNHISAGIANLEIRMNIRKKIR